MTAGTVASASKPASSARPRRRLRGRLAARALGGLTWVLLRLPDGLLHRSAHAIGGLLYLVQPGRRALVRHNLARVCSWLVEASMAKPAVAAAATDGRALDRLVRDAFGHYARSYLESLIVERYARRDLSAIITADDPALAERIFGAAGSAESRSLLLVGMHFGAIEIPALWATRHGIRLTSPMETIADPDLQDFIFRRRAASGLSLIPLAGARQVLSQRLAEGESVAIVADRLVAGHGAPVTLFGAAARLPIGAAALALESGRPAWAVAVRRTGSGRYHARLEAIEMPAEGSRRDRMAGFMASQAAAFERLIADAPEQWWTLLFPIWRGGDS